MTFDFIFSRSQARIIQSVMIDSRAKSMPIAVNGNQIKVLVDAEVAKVTPTVIFYKIETNNGVLVGYFSLQVNTQNKSATLLQYQIRPPFLINDTTIKQQINGFITNAEWEGDYLFSN